MTSHNFLTSWRSRAGSVVFVAAAVVALSGCNPGSEPGPSASVSASARESVTPSATPTPSPTAKYKPADAKGPAQNVPVPVLPEAAKKETKEGLEAFVIHWFQLLSYAYETGDSKPLETMSGPDCKFCRGLSDNISSAWDENKWVVGGQIQTPAVTVKFLDGGPSQATVQVLQKSITIHNPDGTLFQEPTKPMNVGSQATASFETTGWVLSDLGLIR